MEGDKLFHRPGARSLRQEWGSPYGRAYREGLFIDRSLTPWLGLASGAIPFLLTTILRLPFRRISVNFKVWVREPENTGAMSQDGIPAEMREEKYP